MKKEIVFVGLSGGVDSSVAALRLLKAGHTVVGVFIKVWHPDFLICDWERERLDAMRVAAHLAIPFLTFDAEETYKTEVAEYMIAEYKAGRTPNPDVMCNQHVKFGAFLKFALENGATKIATGHYAQLEHSDRGFHLKRGLDASKDQSYFLWTLTQEQLSHVYFPVGNSLKSEIRAEAQDANLPTFAKSDSQGICFLGHVDIKEFLSHYIEITEGNVIDEMGNVIGRHSGALIYTIGQRHGFTIHTLSTEVTPHYVTHINLKENTVIVSKTPRILEAQDTVSLTKCNWISNTSFESAEAQFRYRQKPFNVTLRNSDNQHAILTLNNNTVEYPSRGQSCVLYHGDECLGGGVIS